MLSTTVKTKDELLNTLDLLKNFPNIEVKYMGFPENWKDKLIDF